MTSVVHPAPARGIGPRVRRVARIAWTACALLLALHAWLYRYQMVNLDGISYLELASAWREGRWADAINGYWSPMYPWLLAVFLAVVNPSPAAEYSTLHAANVAAGLGALAAFAYFLRPFLAKDDGGGSRMPPGLRAAVGYALFTWSALVMLVVWMESPDMLLAAFIFIAAGALTRVARGDSRFRTFALFGAGVGLGYLTKSAMLPVGVLFFFSLVAVARRRYLWLQVVLAAMVCVAFALPWILALSITKGRVTFGETGRLNYVWFVNSSEDWPRTWPPHWPHWSGDPANGTSRSAARRLNHDPAVYEFAAPVPGTYPMWYDVSAWYEGVKPYISIADQLRRLKISAADLYRAFALSPYNLEFFNPQPALLCLLLMSAVALRGSGARRTFMSSWPCWTPALGAIGLYAAVYLEPRYIAAFVVILWMFALDALRAPSGSATGARLLKVCGVTMCAVLCAAVVAATWVEAYPAARRLMRGEVDGEHVAWLTAVRMQQAGLQAGDPIAVAGDAQAATRWAHLVRARIIAEVPRADAWKLGTDALARQTVREAFTRSGATWAVLEHRGEPLPGWHPIEGTPYIVLRLR